jgi:hypothetical protein
MVNKQANGLGNRQFRHVVDRLRGYILASAEWVFLRR